MHILLRRGEYKVKQRVIMGEIYTLVGCGRVRNLDA